MGFECFRCGECCRNLGLVHVIDEEYGDYRFLVRNLHTGDEDLVTVDPDKRALFDDRKIFERLPHACPFFRHQEGSELASCTVHLTRPAICHEYRCWRLLIIRHRGFPAGRVQNIRSLVTDDPVLRRIWDECIAGIAEPDDRRWEDTMIRILIRAGYSVRT